MLCVPTPPIFAYYSGTFGNSGQQFSRLLRKTAITKFMVMSSACFTQAAEFGVLDFFFPSRFHVLQEKVRLRADEGVLIPLSRDVKANIVEGAC